MTEEQQNFLRIFVRSRGNLSEVERSLGVSYPTVRAKLEEIIELLEEEPTTEPQPAESRDDILRRIAEGQLSVDEGLGRLNRMTSNGETNND